MRESEKNTVRNTNRHKEEEGGWIFVSRRKKSTTKEERPSVINGNVSHFIGESWRKKKASTIFIDNVPLFYDTYLLKKLCRGMGRVLHAHLPWRRREISKSRYGFVIFENEDDAEEAVRRLKGVQVFGHKLFVEKSFNGGQNRVKEKEVKFSNEKFVKESFINERRSFAQVVKNSNQQWVRKKMECSSNQEEARTVKWDEFLNFQQENNVKLVSIENLCLSLKKDIAFLIDTITDICKEDVSMDGEGPKILVEEEEDDKGSMVNGEEESIVPESKEEGEEEDRQGFGEGTRTDMEGVQSSLVEEDSEEEEGEEVFPAEQDCVRDKGGRGFCRIDEMFVGVEEDRLQEVLLSNEEEK